MSAFLASDVLWGFDPAYESSHASWLSSLSGSARSEAEPFGGADSDAPSSDNNADELD